MTTQQHIQNLLQLNTTDRERMIVAHFDTYCFQLYPNHALKLKFNMGFWKWFNQQYQNLEHKFWNYASKYKDSYSNAELFIIYKNCLSDIYIIHNHQFIKSLLKND